MALKVPAPSSNVVRITTGMLGYTSGVNGAWRIKLRGKASTLAAQVIASNGFGWEHVSITLKHGTPTWELMCQVKEIFWEPEDCVVQFHPPHSEYVNNHPRCLHLWRCTSAEMPRPPSFLVGVEEATSSGQRTGDE